MRGLFRGDAAADEAAPPPATGGWGGMPGTLKLGLLGLTVLGIVGVMVLPDLSGTPPTAKLQNQDPLPPSPIHDYTPLSPQAGVEQAAANNGDMGRSPPPRRRRRAVQDGAPLALYAGPAEAASASPPPAPSQATPAAASPGAAPGTPTVAMPGEGAIHAVFLTHRSYVIRAGSSLPCTPVEANDSSRTGIVTCRTPKWVRSDDERRGLLPPHTIIVGQIKEGMDRFQKRLGVIYTKIEAPWFTVTFPGIGADAMGRAGEDADIQTFFWDRAGAVALYALMDTAIGAGQAAGSAALSRAVTGSNGTVLNFGSLGGQAQGLASQELQGSINRPPVATRDQALPVTVQVGQDIDLYDACTRAMQVNPLACPLQ